MKKTIWVKVDPWDKDLVTTALEGGADGVVIPEGYADQTRSLGRILTISKDGDLQIGKDVVYYTVCSGEDEEEIAQLARDHQVILTCTDWTVIPLENLIARGAKVIAEVQSLTEAQTAFAI
ncbi:MAG: 3-dehydroquinate synthase II, partial [Desulfobacterales bacterium]|nr:3-dehydroquinate synthase II [Desulfobacterales bacterium]